MIRMGFIFCFFVLSGLVGFSQADTSGKGIDQPYLIVTKMPEFPGGSTAMIEFIQDHLEYPMAEKKADIQGTSMMQFIVERDGSVSDIKAVKTVEGGKNLEKEAERVIKLMPKWKPGVYEDQTVGVYKSIPFYFVLAPRRTNSDQTTH